MNEQDPEPKKPVLVPSPAGKSGISVLIVEEKDTTAKPLGMSEARRQDLINRFHKSKPPASETK